MGLILFAILDLFGVSIPYWLYLVAVAVVLDNSQ